MAIRKCARPLLLLVAFCSDCCSASRFACNLSNCSSVSKTIYCEREVKFDSSVEDACKGVSAYTCHCEKEESVGLSTAGNLFDWGESSAWVYLALRTVVRDILISLGVVDNSLKRDMLRSRFQRILDSGTLAFTMPCLSLLAKAISVRIPVLSDNIVGIISGVLPFFAGVGQFGYDMVKIAIWTYYRCLPRKRKERDVRENLKFLEEASKKLGSLEGKDKDHVLVEVKAALKENIAYCLEEDKNNELMTYRSWLQSFSLEMSDLGFQQELPEVVEGNSVRSTESRYTGESSSSVSEESSV